MYEQSGERTRSFLLTSGPNKNVPFSQCGINRMIEYLDETLLQITVADEEQKSSTVVHDKLRSHFTADQIIAFSHALHLQMFPEGFFEGETGGFGLEKSADGNLSFVGVDAWLASDVMVNPSYGHEAISNGNTSARFYYSFHPRQDGEVSTTKQLCNLRRFRKDFWRYHNFFEFGIEALLHVYPEKVTPKEQKTAYREHNKQARESGTYLYV